MVKKNEFNGVVRVEFESAKATEVACLSLTECLMEIRHDAECRENRHNPIEDGTIAVREGERLVMVMAQSYVKRGAIDENECAEVKRLYQDVRRFRHNRLRIKIYGVDEFGNPMYEYPIGYAWVGKGRGIAEPTNSDNDAENDANEVTACVLSAVVGDWGFIGVSINCVTPKDTNGNSNEYPKPHTEWKIDVKSNKNVDAEIANFLSELALKYPNTFDVSKVYHRD